MGIGVRGSRGDVGTVSIGRTVQGDGRRQDRTHIPGISAGVRSDGRIDGAGLGGGVGVDGRRGGPGRVSSSFLSNHYPQQKQFNCHQPSEALLESIGTTAHQYMVLWDTLERVRDTDPFPAVAEAAAAVIGVVLEQVDVLASASAQGGAGAGAGKGDGVLAVATPGVSPPR